MYLHIDFVRRVSAHHVQDCQAAARVLVEPGIELQGVAGVDHDDLAICNRGFDLPGRESLHPSVWRVCKQA
jgi:hypothetical protein